MQALVQYASFGIISALFVSIIYLSLIFGVRLRKFRIIIPLVIICGFALYHIKFLTFEVDDAFISFQYVKNFLKGAGLVFNAGERVEGYTNFLWILILAAVGKLNLDYVNISRLLGVVFSLLTVLLTYFYARRIFARDYLFSFIPVVFLVVNGSFTAWSASGMETSLFTFLLLAGYLAVLKEKFWLAGIIFALSAMTRPEGALFGVIVLFYLFSLPKDVRIKNALQYVIPASVIAIPYLIWKIYYYGQILPNTFYAKQGFLANHLKMGVFYLGQYALYFELFTLLIIIAIVFFKGMNSNLKLLTVTTAIYFAYILYAGGDWMLGFRFVSVITPILSILSVYGLKILFEKLNIGGDNRKRTLIFLFTCFFISVTQVQNSLLEREFKETTINYQEWVNNLRKAGKWCKNNLPEDTKIAASSIGALAYYSDNYILDILGMTVPAIAKSKHKSTGTIGHQSYDFEYVMKQKPDLMYFTVGYTGRYVWQNPETRTPAGIDAEDFLALYEPYSYNINRFGRRPEYMNCWKLKEFDPGKELVNHYQKR